LISLIHIDDANLDLHSFPTRRSSDLENAGGMTQETANYMVDYALEQGINQFDTANLYSKGAAEITLGKAIRNKREEMIISSKTGVQFSEDSNDGGATRINIEHSIHKTLKRLNSDYLDLYYVHLWDGQVPVEETIQVMNDLIKKGKIRYWGVSNYSGWA